MPEDVHEQFLMLYAAYEQPLRMHVRRLVPSRADADDIMQEVLVVLWRKFGEFRQGSDFRAWAFKVAKYEVLAWRRGHFRDRALLADGVIDLLADQSLDEDSLLSVEREKLRECLSGLEKGQRDLLLAAYQPGNRIQDVALHSGRTVGGFYQWLHRMKRLLLKCVQSRMSVSSARGS